MGRYNKYKLYTLDTSLDGQVTVTLGATGSSGSPNALPVSDGATSNGRNRLIIFADSGDLGGTAFVQLTPNDAEKIIYVRNNLSGSRSILLFQGTYNASNDYEVPAGTTAVVFFNGAGSGAVAANVFNNAHFDAMNVVGGVTITTDDNTAQLTLISTDADANAGPKLKLRRNSASPADDDLIGALDWTSENSNGDEHDFLNLTARMRDVTAGNEDVAYAWTAYLGGTGREIQSFVNTAASAASMVFNEDSQDIDFRVESNNLANMLFVDAAEDKVFIGHGTTHQYDAFGAEIIMQIEAAGTAPYAGIGMVQNSNDADIGPLIFGKSRGTSLGSTTIVQDGDLLGRIEFQGMDGNDLETGASIFAMVDGTPGVDDMPGRLVFNTTADGANSASERMRIDNSGTVHIGTVDTHAWDGAFDGRLRIGDRGFFGTTSGSTQMGYNWYWNGSAYNRIDTDFANRYYQNDGEHVWDTAVSGSGDSAITWVERMKITNGGVVEIGELREQTAGTDISLTMVSEDSGIAISCRSATDGHTPYLQFQKTPATSGNYTATASGDFLGLINFNGVNTSGGSDAGGMIQVKQTGTASGNVPSAMSFFTTEVERMQINASGQVFVGEYTWLDSGTKSGLQVKGGGGGPYVIICKNADTSGGASQIIFLDGSNDICGTIISSATNNTTAYGTSSDYRLKENVTDVSNAISTLKTLKPKTYNFISNPDDTPENGFLAHELATVVPNAVTGEKDAVTSNGAINPQQVDYGKLTPILTAALQEAIAKIETLETKVAALEA